MPGWCVFAGSDFSNSVHHVRAHEGRESKRESGHPLTSPSGQKVTLCRDYTRSMAPKREPLASQDGYHDDLISCGPAALVIGDADSWAADGARNARAYTRTSLRKTRDTGGEQRGRRI